MNKQPVKGLMSEGNIWKQLLFFSIPLVLGNIFQQLYNAVDSIIVGKFVGSQALAAVTSSSPVINMLISFFSFRRTTSRSFPELFQATLHSLYEVLPLSLLV